MFVYCLYISGSMAGDEIHNANDDCVICKAWSKSVIFYLGSKP